jgi:hypothetical protein
MRSGSERPGHYFISLCNPWTKGYPEAWMPLTAETTRVRVNGVAIDPAAMPGALEALPLSLGPCLTVLLRASEVSAGMIGSTGNEAYVVEISPRSPSYYITVSHVLWR